MHKALSLVVDDKQGGRGAFRFAPDKAENSPWRGFGPRLLAHCAENFLNVLKADREFFHGRGA